jgi:hypothetical protein
MFPANIGWSFAIIVFPVSLFVGLVSSWLFYREHDVARIDPFYVRAWWSVLGGLVAWPVCLLLRPSVAHFAILAFAFGVGSVVGIHVYRRVAGRRRA